MGIDLKIGMRVKINPPHEDWQDKEVITILGIGYGEMSGKIRVFNANKRRTAELIDSRVKPYNKAIQ